MDVTIESVTLDGFGTPLPVTGGSPAIAHYDGSTLYCHITPAADGCVEVVFNQTGPNEFLAGGKIGKLTVTYRNDKVDPPLQTLTWEGGLPAGAYGGGQTVPYLAFTPNRKRATLVLPNSSLAKAAAPSVDIPTLSLVYLGGELTGTGPRAYFTNVQLDPDSDFRSYLTARIVWPKEDSMSGPIGSLEVP